MIRSGMAGIVSGMLTSFALGTILVAAVFRVWPAAIALGGLSILGIPLTTVLMRRADPNEMKARAERNEKLLDVWGRGMAKASGGWEPRRPEREADAPTTSAKGGPSDQR